MKNRVIAMRVDLRKMFIGTILVGLIEKSTETKVIKAIIKIIEEWMKNTPNSALPYFSLLQRRNTGQAEVRSTSQAKTPSAGDQSSSRSLGVEQDSPSNKSEF